MARSRDIPLACSCEPAYEPPSFDEKMQAGKSLDDGLAGAMKFDTPSKPFYRPTHHSTRGNASEAED